MTKVKVTTTGSLHANCCKKMSFMIKRQQTDSDSDMMRTLHKLLIFLVLMCFGGNGKVNFITLQLTNEEHAYLEFFPNAFSSWE